MTVEPSTPDARVNDNEQQHTGTAGQQTFSASVEVPVSADRLWQWHCTDGAFERLAPPWQRLQLESSDGQLSAGSEVRFRIIKGPISLGWRARICEWNPPHSFTDIQVKGPFASWSHKHCIESTATGSRLTDNVQYRLPAGLSHMALARRSGQKEIRRLFSFRHQRMAGDLQRWAGERAGSGKTVLISGLSGAIGQRLGPLLRTLGFTVRGLSRSPRTANTFHWDPRAGTVDPEALRGVHAVIHLAGAGIADGRWNARRKAAIHQSRISGTRTLVNALIEGGHRPETFICASGINAYHADGKPHDESAATQTKTFLGKVCADWESEVEKITTIRQTKLCILRTGVVLDPLGGALGKMLLPYSLGLGGPIGGGQQFLSWIAVDDLLDYYVQCLLNPGWQGVFNAVAPGAVRQAQFNRTLGQVIKRPAILPLPAAMVRLLLGEMGEETLLANLQVQPQRALQLGHRFRFAKLEPALRFLLGKG